MALKPAICTQCGGRIEVDDSKEAGVCPSCGTAFITEKVITQYVTQNNFAGATINIQGGVDTENLYTLARRAVQTDNAEDALKYYEMINQRDPNDWESTFYSAWFKNDSSLMKNICIALGMLDSSSVENKKERYAEIGNTLANSGRLNLDTLFGLFDFLLAKDDPNHSEFITQLLNILMNILKGESYYDKRLTLQRIIAMKNPIFKEVIEFGLEEIIDTMPKAEPKGLEETILACDFIDQDVWLKKLYKKVFTKFNLTESQYKDLREKIKKLDPSILSLRKLKTEEAMVRDKKFKRLLVKILIIILIWLPYKFIDELLWRHQLIRVLIQLFYILVAVVVSLCILIIKKEE